MARLYLDHAGLATSTVMKRRWQHNGHARHHLIDPRCGEPSRGDLHSVTVVAPTTTEAEVAAKVTLIRGQKAGLAGLEAQGWSGLLVGHDGTTQLVGRFALSGEFV